ncbi:MAG TPA: hypothetical protein VHZ32_05315 [Rhizomicrobium sp.]|jgi:hypothetical protein|nr:hypothetical protein [Rhizomicrobium sp.]
MKTMYVLSVLLVVAPPALAQSSASRSHEPPQQGLNGKTMESCKPDLQKFCDAANLKQECLVAHWTKISSDCQDALARPMRSGGDGG